MVHGLTSVMVPDLNSGMRMFRLSLYREFRHLLPLKFSFTSTLTVASLYSGYQILYLPIRYEKRIGKSNIKPFKDFFGFTILIIRLATYFDPLRFFLPLSLAVFVIAFLKALRDFVLLDHIGSAAVILFFFAVQFFVTGVLCDAIMRRSQDVSSTARKRRFFEISQRSGD